MNARIVLWSERRFAARDIVEHRWSPRIVCEMPILIRFRNSGCKECTITNTNRAGLCLDTGPVHLTPGTVVELVLNSSSTGDHSDPLLAMVVHSSRGRTGLWLGDDHEQYEKLQAFVEYGGNS